MMTASEFLEKFIAQYFTYNNAFIYIQWDEFTGSIKAVYPLDFPLLEILEDKTYNLYARFTFGAGERVTIPYENLIHIRRHFNRDEIFPVRLACVKHAASVHPEPGSNSLIKCVSNSAMLASA